MTVTIEEAREFWDDLKALAHLCVDGHDLRSYYYPCDLPAHPEERIVSFVCRRCGKMLETYEDEDHA